MKFLSIVCTSVVVLTAFTLTAHDAVAQQPRVTPGVQVVKPNDSTLSERVNALQAQVNQLVVEVKSLNSQIAQIKASTDKDFFADRFRIGALEANAKVKAPISGNEPALMFLLNLINANQTRFEHHQHKFTYNSPVNKFDTGTTEWPNAQK